MVYIEAASHMYTELFYVVFSTMSNGGKSHYHGTISVKFTPQTCTDIVKMRFERGQVKNQ